MKPIKLYIENFLSFHKGTYEFTPMGLTNVDGEDLDLQIKTGAGKSSFIDIIKYSLTGSTSKKIKADAVINWDTGKNMVNIFTFLDDNGDEISIHRYRKHSKFGNDFFLVINDDNENPIRGKDARETQELLDKRLGFNEEIFTKAIYFGQFDDIDKFLAATDAKKKELIGKICDLSAYDNMHDNVKEQLKIDTEAAEKIEQDIRPIKSSLETLNDTLKNQSDLSISWQSKYDAELERLEKLNTQFDIEKRADIQKIESEIKGFEDDRKKRIEYLTQQHGEFEESIFNQDKKLKEELDIIIKRREELEDKKKSFKYVDVSVYDEQIKKLNNELKECRGYLEQSYNIKARLNILITDNKKLREEVIELQDKIKTNANSKCPHCYQMISGEAIQKHIDELIKRGVERKALIEASEKEVKELQDKASKEAEINKNKEAVEEEKSKASIANNQIENIVGQIAELDRSITSKKNDITALSELVNPHLNKSKEIEQEVNPFVAEISTKKEAINPFVAELEYINKKVNPYPEQIEAHKKQVNNHAKTVEELKVKIKAGNEQLDKAMKEFDNYNHQIDLGVFWKDGLGIYIKSYLMDSFLDQLTIQANQYLETLFDGLLRVNFDAVTAGKKGVKEKINQQIFKGVQECDYEALSGGERCRVCLAVNLAVSDITAKSLHKSFNFLMMDEILTGLDDAGKKQTMRLLKELEAKFDTIFVIDHAEEFKSYFTNRILITKQNGISTIN